MRIGKLDRRLTLLRRDSITRDTQGAAVETWTAYATVWAGKEDLRGREFYAADQMQGRVTTKFLIRWRDDVLLTDRLSCEGLTYKLTGAPEVGRRQGLELLAEAVRE